MTQISLLFGDFTDHTVEVVFSLLFVDRVHTGAQRIKAHASS